MAIEPEIEEAAIVRLELEMSLLLCAIEKAEKPRTADTVVLSFLEMANRNNVDASVMLGTVDGLPEFMGNFIDALNIRAEEIFNSDSRGTQQ